MYSIEVTEREKELGYSLGPVPNPKQVFCTEADEVTAVMYRLDKDNFIIKTIYPVGGYRYCHRQKRAGGWVTVCNEHADPQDAIIKARETISKKQ